MHGVALQWIGSIVAGLVATAVLHLWRRGAVALRNINRVVGRFDAAAKTIETFGKQWEAAVLLDEAIRADRSDMEALILQLGTRGREPGWAALEAYLHEWRHEQANDRTVMSILADNVRSIAGDVKKLVNE